VALKIGERYRRVVPNLFLLAYPLIGKRKFANLSRTPGWEKHCAAIFG